MTARHPRPASFSATALGYKRPKIFPGTAHPHSLVTNISARGGPRTSRSAPADTTARRYEVWCRPLSLPASVVRSTRARCGGTLTASGTETRTFLLDRRARYIAIGAVDAAVALLGLELNGARFADMDVLAGVRRHHVRRAMPALRAGYRRSENDGGRLPLVRARVGVRHASHRSQKGSLNTTANTRAPAHRTGRAQPLPVAGAQAAPSARTGLPA